MSDPQATSESTNLNISGMTREELIAARPKLLDALRATGAVVMQREVAGTGEPGTGFLLAIVAPGELEVPNDRVVRVFKGIIEALEDQVKAYKWRKAKAIEALSKLKGKLS